MILVWYVMVGGDVVGCLGRVRMFLIFGVFVLLGIFVMGIGLGRISILWGYFELRRGEVMCMSEY